jgi:hypothetical protein
LIKEKRNFFEWAKTEAVTENRLGPLCPNCGGELGYDEESRGMILDPAKWLSKVKESIEGLDS